MRIAYQLHWNDGPGTGVWKKVAAQVSEWRARGHAVRMFLLVEKGSVERYQGADPDLVCRAYRSRLGKFSAMRDLAKAVEEWMPDVIYRRYDAYYPAVELLMIRFPVVLEINSDDGNENVLRSDKLRRLYLKITRRRQLSRAAGIVYVTRELSALPHFSPGCAPYAVIGNGIDLKLHRPLAPANSAEPSLVFLGSPGQTWHGVDKIARLAKLFPLWQFHVVGPAGSSMHDYPSNMTFHGYLRGADYETILAEADVAIGSLALHRIAGMSEASPLKVREYLAHGIPTIIGYKDTDFSSPVPFLLELPSSEKNVEEYQQSIEHFVNTWRGKRVPRSEITHIDSQKKEVERLSLLERAISSWRACRSTSDAEVLMPRRLVLLSTGLGTGGAENQVVRLASALGARGWHVKVITLLEPGPSRAELSSHGIRVCSLSMRGYWDLRALLRLTRILRQVRPLVLHSHMVHANLLGRLAGALANVPLQISTAHSLVEGPRWREIAYRLSDSLSDLTTQVSQAGLDRYVRVGAVPRHKAAHVPNGIDLAPFDTSARTRDQARANLGMSNEFVWLAVGRLDVAKDYHTMLQACRHLSNCGRPFRLLIAGDGPLRDELAQCIRDEKLGAFVQLLGSRDDIPTLMAAADGFVMSSAWEGMPMVLLEAGAAQLPVVATAVGGIPEVVVESETGFLCPPHDPAGLGDAMRRMMLLSNEVRATMGAAARLRVESHFEIGAVAQAWERIYLETLRSKGVDA